MTRITISQAAKRGFGFNPTLYRAIAGRMTPLMPMKARTRCSESGAGLGATLPRRGRTWGRWVADLGGFVSV